MSRREGPGAAIHPLGMSRYDRLDTRETSDTERRFFYNTPIQHRSPICSI